MQKKGKKKEKEKYMVQDRQRKKVENRQEKY